MPIHTILTALLGAAVALQPAEPPTDQPSQPAAEQQPAPATYETARDLLDALAKRDADTHSLTGTVRLTAIQALQGDTQSRSGKLALRTVRTESGNERRLYAVIFEQLVVGNRVQDVNEEYIFDGRWFVERHPDERQFIKREVVPQGQTLDPMELMREAPFWISVGDDADRIFEDYNAGLHAATEGIADDPELAGLAPLVEGTVQFELTPKPGSAGEDDWESVRMWFDARTLLPRLYVKTEWTGDRQIAELFGVKTNTEVPERLFDTTTPDVASDWQVQVVPWRGRADG